MTPCDLVKGSVRLVSLPDIYIKVVQALEDPASSMADIGRVLSQDPALAARLLKIANSPFYGFPSRIDSIPRAVTVIGEKNLRELVLIASVGDVITRIAGNLMDMTAFWRHSTYCGVAARALGRKCGIVSVDALFVAGLLHDVGRLLILTKLPEMARGAYLRPLDERQQLCDVEREILGFHHGEVGGELLRIWALPESICEAVQHHHEPAQARTAPLVAAVIHVADALARHAHPLQLTHGAFPPSKDTVPSMDEHALRLTGLTNPDVLTVMADVETQLGDLLGVLLPKAA